jgi:hypothetical protein
MIRLLVCAVLLAVLAWILLSRPEPLDEPGGGFSEPVLVTPGPLEVPYAPAGDIWNYR